MFLGRKTTSLLACHTWPYPSWHATPDCHFLFGTCQRGTLLLASGPHLQGDGHFQDNYANVYSPLCVLFYCYLKKKINLLHQFRLQIISSIYFWRGLVSNRWIGKEVGLYNTNGGRIMLVFHIWIINCVHIFREEGGRDFFSSFF